MAKVSGAAGYQQLQPVNSGISQSAQYWGGITSNLASQGMRMAQRNKELEEARKAQAVKSWEDDFKKSNSALKLFDTKHKQGNEIVAHAVFRLGEMNYKAHQVLDPRNKKATAKEKMEARLEIQRIEQYIPMIKAGLMGVTEHIANSDKEIAEGKAISDPVYENFKRTFSTLDENERITDVAVGDDNRLWVLYKDQGTGDVGRILVEDIVQGKMPKPMRNINFESTVEFSSKLVGESLEEYQKGLYTYKKGGINELSEELLENMAQSYYKIEDNGMPSLELVGYLNGRGYDPFSFSKEEYEQIIPEVRKRFKLGASAKIKKTNSELFDHSANIGYGNLAERKKENAKKGKDEEPGFVFATDPETGNILEREIRDGNNTYTGFALTNNDKGKPIILNKTGATETRIDNVYITKNGKMYGDVYTIKKEKSFAIGKDDDGNTIYSEPKEIIERTGGVNGSRWLTVTEANNIAIERKYEDARSMYEKLDKQMKAQQSQANELPDINELPDLE